MKFASFSPFLCETLTFTGSAIICFKCRSINNNNGDCTDPFTLSSSSQAKVERRECPAFERCAKITGINSNSQSYVIRDCYRASLPDARFGSYKDPRIPYYQDIIDGQINFCNYNLCNSSPRVFSYWTSVVLVIFFLRLIINWY